MSFEKGALPPIPKRKHHKKDETPRDESVLLDVDYTFTNHTIVPSDEIEQEIFSSIFKVHKSYLFASRREGKILEVDSKRELEELLIQAYPKKVQLLKGKSSLLIAKDKLTHVCSLNNATSMNYRIDPFLQINRLTFEHKMLTYATREITLIAPSYKIDEEVIRDYQDHFPLIEELIEWMVACRFTKNRRESFVHLRANANFGKSFFKSILKDLGIAYEMNVEDFRAPSGVNPDRIRNTFILFIDEFRIFKQEYKNMTNHLSIDSKHREKEEVEVFAKVFLSAERSASFNDGVDPQISDRVSVVDLKDTSKLADRAVYKNKGGDHYYQAVRHYLFRSVKTLIDSFVALGVDTASKKAEEILKSFHTKFAIQSNTLDEEIRTVTYEILASLRAKDESSLSREEKDIRACVTFLPTENFVTIKFFEKGFAFYSESFYKKARHKLNKNTISQIFGVEETRDDTKKARPRGFYITLPSE